jgi:hypothetical protein
MWDALGRVNGLWYILAIWVIPWKGVALWKAARRSDKWWFVVLLVLNTFAILEILYIFIWSKRPLKTPVREMETEV